MALIIMYAILFELMFGPRATNAESEFGFGNGKACNEFFNKHTGRMECLRSIETANESEERGKNSKCTLLQEEANFTSCVTQLCSLTYHQTNNESYQHKLGEFFHPVTDKKLNRLFNIICILREMEKKVPEFEDSCEKYDDWLWEVCWPLNLNLKLDLKCGYNKNCRRTVLDQMKYCEDSDKACLQKALERESNWYWLWLFMVTGLVIISLIGLMLLLNVFYQQQCNPQVQIEKDFYITIERDLSEKSQVHQNTQTSH